MILMNILKGIKRAARVLFMLLGVGFVLLVGLCFTGYPWRVYDWLAADGHVLTGDPAYIVVLGGGGIPSESGLIRTYYGGEAGHRFPGAKLIVALPVDGEVAGSPTDRMREELILRGIERDRILLETRGMNTRAQAIQIRLMIGEGHADTPLMVVTCPEHMKRSLLTFRKAGFDDVAAYSARATYGGGDLSYDGEVMEADFVPSVEGGLMVRYQFWNHIGYLTRSARELSALAYYRWKGWI